jgi:PIN domain nuclease of toxin-antitoxin system
LAAVLLLDTHLVLCAAFEPGRLSPKARKLLESRAEPLAFSLATILEVVLETSLQRPGFAGLGSGRSCLW